LLLDPSESEGSARIRQIGALICTSAGSTDLPLSATN
jgi:hypothetical protein